MPSLTLNNPEDKSLVKRFLSSPDTKIITATVARLYVAYPDPYQWTYSGVIGAVALIQTANTFYLRIVDLLYGRGIVWEQELYNGFVYTRDKAFFHSFQTDSYIAGFSFADEHEADIFFGKVHGRANLRPFKPVLAAGGKSGKSAGGQGLNKIPLVNGKVDKSRIGQPLNFQHVAHIGWNQDVGFDAQNVNPAWLELYEELNCRGVSRRQINENATFITEFINAHGGLEKNTAGTKLSESINNSKLSDNSRKDSPPLRPLSPQQKRPPPPPPPPPPTAQANTNGNTNSDIHTNATNTASPAAFHGYLPRPLAQVMASLTLGASSFYGTTTPSSPPSQSPQVPSAQLDPTVPPDNVPLSVGTTAPSPPPPPPPPPPLPSFKTSISTPNPANGLRSPIENSLLASIRETGGVQGLRKTGGLRSPPPVRARPASPLGATNSQGDLVSALVAALQQRQTRVTYSDDEGHLSEEDDSWDEDD
ncbi:hypothetical protein BGZ65_007612 [Modicella reniformis]|uniref:WH1-domain-containing protein n=1 Tax=Modicella reniformis TaxID=1440133 RepID=A0A9P6JGU6_9FUNG|nr:hypothetical protein BGZ65_007612 [Modicella reniformis]